MLFDGFQKITRSLAGSISESETAMTDSLNSVRSTCENLNTSLAAMRKGIEENNASVDAACAVAGPWVERLEELEKKSDLTKQEQAEWNTLLGKLSATIPEVSGLINLQTGEIEGGTAALKNYIKQWENYAKAKVYAEKAEEAARQLVDAEIALGDAEKKYTAAKGQYNDAIDQSKNLIAEVTAKYPALLGVMDGELDSLYALQIALGEYGSNLGVSAEDMAAYCGQVDELSSTINGLGGDYSNLSLSTEELGGVMGEHRVAVDELKQAYSDAQAEMETYVEKSQECTTAASDIATSFTMSTGQVVKSNDQYISALRAMYSNSKDTALNSALALKQMGKDADASTKEAADRVLSNFENLPDDMKQSGKDTLLGLIGGMEGQIPGLANASEMSADEIVSTLRSYLGIHSPSKVTEDIGRNVMAGLNNGIRDNTKNVVASMLSAGQQAVAGMKNGMQSQLSSLLSAARSIADKVTSAFKARLDIHSPSKRLAREVGKPSAQGIGVGFKDAMPGVMRSMERSLDHELGRMPSSALSVQHQIQPMLGSAASGPAYNIVNNIESPVPITVEDGVKAANRASEDALFRLGVGIA